jgi:4'-phosphopantetheinyl transferase
MRNAGRLSVYLLRLPREDAGRQPPAWLGKDDRRRYLSMSSSKRRGEFSAGRLLLTYALGRFHAGTGQRWQLISPEGEPPRVEIDGGGPAPTVSLAHCAGLVTCAVASLPRVGVDVESRHVRRSDVQALARATLHPLEYSGLMALPETEHERYFLRCWTQKEALAKALGRGLSLPFREFGFDGERLVESPRDWRERHEHWRFASLAIGTAALLSLAWTLASPGELAEPYVEELERRQIPEFAAS